MTTFFANARMYALTPGADRAWARLFGWIARESEIALDVLAYPPPAPLDALWARTDLGAVFICGFPYAHRSDRPTLLAAPIPAAADYGGRAVYWSDLICRRDAPFSSIEDCFGLRFGWTVRHSQSGFNAPRRFLADFATARGAPLFASVVGDLVTPRRVVDAVVSGEIDCGPLDSFAHDLLRRHEPALCDKFRVLARTRPTPIPPVMATAPLTAAAVVRLRAAFAAVQDAPDLAKIRDDLCLLGFALPSAVDYDVLRRWADEAEALGYSAIS